MSTTPISNELREAVLRRDGYRCRYCGDDQGPFHIDHVYPESKGGLTILGNLVTACSHCNLSKGDRIGRWPNPIEPLAITTQNGERSNRRWITVLYLALATFFAAMMLNPEMRSFWPIYAIVFAIASWFMATVRFR